jgi:hypothetical protein
MPVQVSPVQKKEDPAEGMMMQMGASLLQSKIGGGGAKKPELKPEPKPEAPKPGADAGGSGTSLGDLINAQNTSGGSTPVDRRMGRRY